MHTACFTLSRRHSKAAPAGGGTLHGKWRRRRRSRSARLQPAHLNRRLLHLPPAARRPTCPLIGPSFSTRSSLSLPLATHRRLRRVAGLRRKRRLPPPSSPSARDAAEEKDAALQAISDMRADGGTAGRRGGGPARLGQPTLHAWNLARCDWRCRPCGPSRAHRWHWATPSGLPGVLASPSFSTPLSKSCRPPLNAGRPGSRREGGASRRGAACGAARLRRGKGAAAPNGAASMRKCSMLRRDRWRQHSSRGRPWLVLLLPHSRPWR